MDAQVLVPIIGPENERYKEFLGTSVLPLFLNLKAEKIMETTMGSMQTGVHCQPIAYFWVQLRAVDSYLALSVLYICAISGTRGSSGFGSVRREHIDNSTCKQDTLDLIFERSWVGGSYHWLELISHNILWKHLKRPHRNIRSEIIFNYNHDLSFQQMTQNKWAISILKS